MSSSKSVYDVLIVGASATGLFAAQQLAKAGCRVAVFERRARLGEPARTWIVTPKLYEFLDGDPAEAVVNRVDHMELISASETTSVTLHEPDLIVERALLLNKLEAWALSAGAEIFTNHNVGQIKFNNGAVHLTVTDNATQTTRTLTALYLLGADGTHSHTARQLNAPPQWGVPVLQAHVKLPRQYDPRHVKVWFKREHTSYFYWLIPESPETAVLGLVADQTEGARALLDQFSAHHGFHCLTYQGAVIPLHQPWRQLEWREKSARILLVGDAASHVKVTTVGGLVSGLWGTRAAVDSLLKGTPYNSMLQPFNQELYVHDLIRWTLNRFSNEDYDQLLRGLNHALRTLLSQRNRDTMAEAFFTLAFSQPKLSGLALYRMLFPYRPAPGSTIPKEVPQLTPLKTDF